MYGPASDKDIARLKKLEEQRKEQEFLEAHPNIKAQVEKAKKIKAEKAMKEYEERRIKKRQEAVKKIDEKTTFKQNYYAKQDYLKEKQEEKQKKDQKSQKVVDKIKKDQIDLYNENIPVKSQKSEITQKGFKTKFFQIKKSLNPEELKRRQEEERETGFSRG